MLEPLDHIECRDALLVLGSAGTSVTSGSSVVDAGSFSGSDGGVGGAADGGSQVPGDLHIATTGHPAHPTTEAHATEAPWPRADVVVGNPPFLGDKKMRAELGGAYIEALRKAYEGRVPGGANLVCYWFDKARVQMESGALGAAGLVATNSIRGGKNRVVLDAIVKSTRIFEAWSDEPWVNDGAAVRVSLVAFGCSSQNANLDGTSVCAVFTDLTADAGEAADLTRSQLMSSNKAACFIGGMKKGPFDISGQVARQWLTLPNPNGISNATVVKPWFNGLDVTRRPLDQWIVDFGIDTPKEAASMFEAPFAHIQREVLPQRAQVRNELEKARWWLHARPAPDLRRAAARLPRSIATARVAKYRLFAWINQGIVVDGQLVITARADDTTFGILHSRFHERWSLGMCTWMGVGNDPRYTPTTCFETFPFPEGLTPADTAHQQTEALESGARIPAQITEPALKAAASRIAEAAKTLNERRETWLNPPEWTVRVPEVIPLGMDHSPYPDRIVPKPDLSTADAAALQKRTLTNLYNARPA